MKISLILIFTAIFHLNAVSGHSQNALVNISQNNMSVGEFISAIEKQTNYLFLYNERDINLNQRISVDIKNEPLEEALKQAFSSSDIVYVFSEDYIALRKKTDTTDTDKKVIKGIVTDEYGDPVIGANVVEKGTTNGIMTNMDGEYTLSVTPGATVQVTYVGYLSREFVVGAGTDYPIVIHEDIQKLEEVLVIGYGTARRSDVTGSVVRANLETMRESPNISVASALHGTIPGLNVGAATEAGKDPTISIRGRNSISGGTTPLIVLDGIIFRGSMVDINMNDVESIDVLKDASSAAIYGSQASNGVLLITSKSGKTGKPVIEYSGSVSLQNPTRNLRPQNREGFLNRIADRFLEESRTGTDMLQRNPDWDPVGYLDDLNAINGYLDGVETDWWDLLTNDTPYIQNHNVSVRGKSDLSSYFFSLGYTDQKNLIINDTYKRYNVRINLDSKITDWLNVGVQSFFTSSDYSGVSPTLSTVMRMPSLVPAYDEEGDYILSPYQGMLNPLLEVEQDDENRRYNLFGNFYADVQIPYIKGLKYRLNYSQNLILSHHYNFNPWGSTYTGNGYKENSSEYSWTADNILSYDNTFGKHAVNGTLVYGAEKRTYESTKAYAENFTNTGLGYNKLDAGRADLQSVTTNAWEESSLYMMARLGYTFDNRYSFTGTVRRDGFSGFGEKNKFGIFPSAALAWRITEEEFFKNLNYTWIDYLKLRLSYGTNGNRTVGRYQTLAQLGSQDGYLFGDGASAEQMQWISSLANDNLKWETTNTFNAALDFTLFNNRVSGTFEYYTSRTKNLLYNINIPRINGLNTIASNIGQLNNKGQELTITGIPVQTKDFSWEVTFNFSRNRNKVVSILGIDADGDGKEDDLVANKIFMGHPYGVVYDYNIIGMWQLADYHNGVIPDGFTYGTYKVEDINGDGRYTADEDRKILGYTDPAYRFSIQNSLRYKSWEFKFLINSVQGGKNYYYGQPGSTLQNPDNIYKRNGFDFDYWTPENPNARYRQIGYYTQALGSDFSPYVQRSFVRLQDGTLSYTVPSGWLRNYNINRLKVYVTGSNLLTFTDWDGWDPETGVGLAETGFYPVMRSYSFGINLEF